MKDLQELLILMITRICFCTMALLVILSSVSVIQAAEQSDFDYTNLENKTILCKKTGGDWLVNYGVDKKGFVVYAIFTKTDSIKGRSPVSTLTNNQTHVTTLHVLVDGKDLPPPGPKANSMVIQDGRVKRGKFNPFLFDAFRKFLLDQSPLTIDSIEVFAKDSGGNSNSTSNQKDTEQGGTEQPATRPQSKSKGGDKP